jgi:hypothetical protein
VCKCPDQESHDAPMRPPKIWGCALGFAVVMQGDDSGHTADLFHDLVHVQETSLGMLGRGLKLPLPSGRAAPCADTVAPEGGG